MINRIMVIDDDDDFSTYLSVLLVGVGYVVDKFAEAESALESVAISPPNLILCDLLMPGMDGLQFIQKFRQRYPDCAHIPVVLVSAKDNKDEIIRAKYSGADDFIAKPIDMALFLATVECRLEQINRIRNSDLALTIFKSEESRTGKDSQLYKQMCNAIDDGEFSAHYQPKVCQDGTIRGAEALARWSQDGKTFIPPSVFIPVAERYNLILPLTEIIFDQILKDVERWHNDGQSAVNVSVNLSTAHFSLKHLHQLFECIPQDIFNQISFEITESSLIGNLDKVGDMIREAVSTGSQFYIDDFGTGFSSLSYLPILPVTGLKVDKSFVDNCATDNRSAALLNNILNLGAIFDLDIIGEGVEQEDQKTFLFDAGCDELQGYLFSPAIDSAHYEQQYIEKKPPSPHTKIKNRASTGSLCSDTPAS